MFKKRVFVPRRRVISSLFVDIAWADILFGVEYDFSPNGGDVIRRAFQARGQVSVASDIPTFAAVNRCQFLDS